MSTASMPEGVTSTPRRESAAEPRARFADLLAAEWIKLRSLRSTWGVLVAGALAVIGICANSARSNVHLIQANGTEEQRLAIDPMHAAFVPDAYLIIMILAGAVGAMAVSGEYASGLIRTTFAAVPARRQVIAAKAAVVTAALLVFGAVVAASSFGLTQAIYDEVRIGLPADAPGAPRAIAASALLAPLCGLVGMALAALVRHVAGTVVAVVVVLAVLPRLFAGETYRWAKEIGNAMPVSAWSALVENPAARHVPARYPVGIGEAWTVYGAWALVAVVVAVVVVHRRDV
ncbi:ABC transporter permease subunit [Spirillospora sp. CA-255316]